MDMGENEKFEIKRKVFPSHTFPLKKSVTSPLIIIYFPDSAKTWFFCDLSKNPQLSLKKKHFIKRGER